MGERGHQPSATVWSMATGAVVRKLAGGHRFGIGCISFTPSGGGVVTMGFKHDRMLRVSVVCLVNNRFSSSPGVWCIFWIKSKSVQSSHSS